MPWRDIPKTPKDLLIDVLVELPGLLEDVDSCHPRKDVRFELEQRCWAYDEQLRQWRAGLGIINADYTLKLDDISSYSFDLIAAVHLMCLYWTTCIILYSTLRSVCEPSHHASLPIHTDPRPYCRRIARAVSVLLHPQSGVHGALLTNFPVSVTLHYLNAKYGGVDLEEKRIMLDAFSNAKHGGIVKGFTASMQRHRGRS